jgi:hypothetical protein
MTLCALRKRWEVMAVMLALFLPHEGEAASSPRAEVRSIRASPYYVASGELRSAANLFDPRVVLRNILIFPPEGRDAAKRESVPDWDVPIGTTVTFAQFEIVSASTEETPRVRLRAETAAGTLVEKQLDLRKISGKSRTWIVPLLIYGTGCEPLRLSATVYIGSSERPEHSLSRTIPFSCGE